MSQSSRSEGKGEGANLLFINRAYSSTNVKRSSAHCFASRAFRCLAQSRSLAFVLVCSSHATALKPIGGVLQFAFLAILLTRQPLWCPGTGALGPARPGDRRADLRARARRLARRSQSLESENKLAIGVERERGKEEEY